MKNTNNVETITKSETKKAVRYFEKKHPGSSVIASGWATHPQTEDDKVTGFQTVSVELWSEEERESYTVYLAVCLWDRRKTFVMKDAENWYTEPTKEETATDNTENEEGESQKGKNTMKQYYITSNVNDRNATAKSLANGEKFDVWFTSGTVRHYDEQGDLISTESGTMNWDEVERIDPSFAEEVTEATKEEGGETEAAPAYTITTNTQYSSVEVSFNGKPAEEVRNALKALRFRWHGQKKVWYGYATEEAVRAAIEGQSGEEASTAPKSAPKASKATKATQKAQGTQQDHIRIYWNGIKIDGGRLIRCGYSIDNNAENTPSVSIYARDYDHLPRDLFEVRNESDSYTDYFENDSAYLTPEHPLYKYFRFAAMKAKARDDSKYCEYLRETLNSGKREPWAGHYDGLRADLARREKTLAEFAQMTDPGQPTAEDLAEIDRQRQEAENARKAAEHEAELREREIYLAQRVNGQRLIKAEQDAHPIEAGEPVVCINWSEHPAFEAYADDGLVLSLTAAENILRELDHEQHETRESDSGRGWYFKTKFTITGTDAAGEPFTYTGRYDLGDGDGGLVEHIRAFGRYFLTHDEHGHTKPQPDETNDTIRFADFLAGFVA